MAKSAAPRMNVKLLRKIQKHILAEPLRLKMRGWLERKGRNSYAFYESDGGVLVRFPACGTAACIGGWALILSGEKVRTNTFLGDRAAKILGLDRMDTTGGMSNSDKLFIKGNWPSHFAIPFIESDDPAERARIAAERIDHFIKTKGAE